MNAVTRHGHLWQPHGMLRMAVDRTRTLPTPFSVGKGHFLAAQTYLKNSCVGLIANTPLANVNGFNNHAVVTECRGLR